MARGDRMVRASAEQLLADAQERRMAQWREESRTASKRARTLTNAQLAYELSDNETRPVSNADRLAVIGEAARRLRATEEPPASSEETLRGRGWPVVDHGAASTQRR